MRELPRGWARATIPDLIASDGVFVDGDWVESKDQDPSGDVRLIQLADVGDGRYVDKSNRFLTHERASELGCTFLKAGDVLVARMPDPLGRACLFPGDRKASVTVVDVCVVRGRNADLDAAWLMHFINSPSFRADVNSLQSGSTRKRISRGNLSTLPLPVPPRAEQTRIVAKLEELLSDLDAGVAELKAAQVKLQHYRQSLLKAAVEGSLTAAWREANPAPEETGADLLARILRERRARWEAQQLAKFEVQGKTPPKGWQSAYPEPAQPDANALPALPQSWTWATLDALIVAGPQNGLYLPKERYAAGVPIVRIDDYQIGWHRPREGLRQVTANGDEVDTYGLETGDLVINRVNSMTHLGKSMRVPSSLAGAVFESNMMRLSLSAAVESEFVSAYLGSEIGRMRLTAEAKWAVNQASINQQDVRRTPVPIPPLAEQSSAVLLLSQQLSAAGELVAALEAAQAQSTAQRQNLLRAAFAGQLVPQDPADEPAAELLARIRAGRAEASPVRRGRRAHKTSEPA